MAADQQPAFVAKGNSGQLTVYPDRIVISHRGFSALLAGGNRGDKEVGIAQITAIQWKSAGLTAGYIRFTFAGSSEKSGGAINAQKDENAVTFNMGKQQKEFEQARALIEEYRAALARPAQAVAAPVSSADELAKWAGLRDQGLITADDFEAKKRQLLGL